MLSVVPEELVPDEVVPDVAEPEPPVDVELDVPVELVVVVALAWAASWVKNPRLTALATISPPAAILIRLVNGVFDLPELVMHLLCGRYLDRCCELPLGILWMVRLARMAASRDVASVDSRAMQNLAEQLQAAPKIINPHYLLDTFGLAGMLTIIFAECGLLIGFFLPGDTLLFIAGLLIASGAFNTPLAAVMIGVPIAASAGSLVGYWIGRAAGPRLFDRPDSKLFKRRYVDQAHQFFERRGAFAIIAARFVPVVRTFITVVAGVARMDFKRYAILSILVSCVWGAGVPLAGYLLGNVKFVAGHVEYFAVGIAVVSALPIVFEFFRHRRAQRA